MKICFLKKFYSKIFVEKKEFFFNSLIYSNAKGQVSLEYLLIVTAFFSILLIVLPIAVNTMDSFLFASDDLTAKSIVSELNENISLMNFLGEGSSRVFDYSPLKGLTIYSIGSKLIIQTESNNFEVETFSPQLIQKTFFDSKFSITLKKSSKGIVVQVQ
ncbi:MAG: hypothetical protein PHY04_00370 [Candidatus ainarchaeum sp.]|nr:hypothetical protein [Candidatus ainarchaeum sp.]